MSQRTGQIIRRLGDVERFFHASHQLLGSFHVAGMYKLSRSISLPKLQQCAQMLRSKHRILQVDVQDDLHKRYAYYTQADDLEISVTEDKHFQDPHHLLDHVIQNGEAKQKSTAKNSRVNTTKSHNNTLPWSLTLSNNGDHVIFSAPHSISDGVSLEIIGSDLVYALNGRHETNQSPIELPKPVENQFGDIPFALQVNGYYQALKTPFKSFESGLDTYGLSRDWTNRNSFMKTDNLTVEDLSVFYDKCKSNGFSLNSGMVSAFYEAVGMNSAFDTNGKIIPMCIPVDVRRRVDKNSNLSMRNPGAYVGSLSIPEKAEPGRWIERAKTIQNHVRSSDMLKEFVNNWIPMGLSARYSQKAIPLLATGKNLGRISPLCFSNLGRTSLIDQANSDCFADEKSDHGVRIENLWFDESGSGIGFFVSIHMARVGDNISWCISGLEPFVSKHSLATIQNDFRNMLISS